MGKILTSIARGLDDLRAPGMLKLFIASVGLTALAGIATISLGFWLADTYLADDIASFSSSYETSWLQDLITYGFWLVTAFALFVIVMLTFWSLMIFIASFFDEHIAALIERHRYPSMPIGQERPFWPEFLQDLRFIAKAALYNLGLFVIPLFWPFLPILLPLLNGWLLGRQFFRMAGGRHVGRKAADAIASRHKPTIILAGCLIVIASGIPFLNLLVPFWGVTMMVHLYHQLAGTPPVKQEVLPPS